MCWVEAQRCADWLGPVEPCCLTSARAESHVDQSAESVSLAVRSVCLLRKLSAAFNKTPRPCWSPDEDFLPTKTCPQLNVAAMIRSCCSIICRQLLHKIHRIVASRGCTGECMRCGLCCCLAATAAAVCVTCVSCQQLIRGICWNFKRILRYSTCHRDCLSPPRLYRLRLLLSALTGWHSC